MQLNSTIRTARVPGLPEALNNSAPDRFKTIGDILNYCKGDSFERLLNLKYVTGDMVAELREAIPKTLTRECIRTGSWQKSF